MHDLAASLGVRGAGPRRQARDLLASSYRKLGGPQEVRQGLSPRARQRLSRGHRDRPAGPVGRAGTSFAFKAHLAIALDDLAGVAKGAARDRRGEDALPRGRAALCRAGRTSDPENLESELTLLPHPVQAGAIRRGPVAVRERGRRTFDGSSIDVNRLSATACWRGGGNGSRETGARRESPDAIWTARTRAMQRTSGRSTS